MSKPISPPRNKAKNAAVKVASAPRYSKNSPVKSVEKSETMTVTEREDGGLEIDVHIEFEKETLTKQQRKDWIREQLSGVLSPGMFDDLFSEEAMSRPREKR